MLYVPIKLYPNQQSLKGCIIRAAFWLALAVVGYQLIENHALRLGVYGLCMIGFSVPMLNAIAVLTKQPVIKVLDDRFTVYTPFGSAYIRFGEVLAFKEAGVLCKSLRVEVNNSARPKFPSSIGKILHTLVCLNFTNSVTVPGYMLGADPESVVGVLEKRRLSAVRLESIGDYNPTALTDAA